MLDLLTISIGVGLVVSLLFAEFFGFKAGGLVVPGYFALYLTHPLNLALTVGLSFIVFLCVRLLSSVVIIYGKRRTAIAILLGYLLGVLARMILGTYLDTHPTADLTVIGYIIPGLIALWMDRQGALTTFASLLTATVVTRLVLVLIIPMELQRWDMKHQAPQDAVDPESETTE